MPKLSPIPGSQSTSSSTGAHILVRVRALLNEATAKFWDDTDLYQYITDGVINVTATTYCTGGSEDITLTTGTLEYAIVGAYIDIVAVIYDTVKALLLGHPSMLGHVKSPGEVVYYYEFDGNIGFIPKPVVADNTKKAKVYYLPMPDNIGAGTAIPVPKWLDHAVVLYAVAMALFEDNEMQSGMQVLREYEKSVEKFSRKINDTLPAQINDARGK